MSSHIFSLARSNMYRNGASIIHKKFQPSLYFSTTQTNPEVEHRRILRGYILKLSRRACYLPQPERKPNEADVNAVEKHCTTIEY